MNCISSRSRERARRLVAALTVAALAACRTDGERLVLEIDALESTRHADSARLEHAMLRGDPATRSAAARAAGRIGAASLAAPLCRALAGEDDPEVRAEQLFALGQIGSAEALDAVQAHLDGSDAVARARACDAVGKFGKVEVAPSLVARLADPAAQVRGAAALALARLVGRRSANKAPLDPAVVEALGRTLPALVADRDAAVSWKASYATAEIECAGRLPAARAAASAGEPAARFFAAVALGRIAEEPAARAAALEILLGDADVFVATQAALAMAWLPEAEWSEARVAVVEQAARATSRSSDHHLRRAALSTLCDVAMANATATASAGAAWIDRARAVCDAAAADPKLLVRGEAWRGQVRLGDEALCAAVGQRAQQHTDVHDRVAAVRALAAAPEARRDAVATILVRLAGDDDAYVASEALTALLPFAAKEAPEARRAALRELARVGSVDPDFAVAASALDLLARVGAPEDLALLVATFARMAGDDAAEARANAAKAAAQLSGASAVPLLLLAAADPSAAVRSAARAALKELDAPVPAEPAAASDAPASSVEIDDDALLAPPPNPRVRLRFAGGDVVIELLSNEAPRHTAMFRERVAAGACDGLPIHRIVSGFVVQGFDPRGDGWGTGGVFLRDEINVVPYERGAIGMPNAGPDSGGCQLFAMLMPAPHLDGRYTVFGRVLQGMDVVDALDLGERCLKAEIVK